MKKEFTTNILFLLGINLLIKPFYSLAIDTSVQNIVGPEDYGIFLALFNFVYIQQIFADLGIQNYNNRNISRNPESVAKVFPKILASKLVFTAFFVFLTIFTSWIFGYLQHFNEILVWVICSQAVLSFLLYLRTNISGTGRYFTDSLFSVLDKLILIIWLSYIIWVSPDQSILTISYFAKVQFASLAISLIFILTFTHKKVAKLSLDFDFEFAKDLLKRSLPYASLILLMAGYSRMDGIMLERMLDDNALEAGKYARSFRLYDTLNNFTFLFAVLLLPMFSRMLKQKEHVQELVTWSFKLLSMASLFAMITVFFRGEEIMNLFFVNVEVGFQTTLFLLISAGLALSLNYIYGTLLTANGDIGLLNRIAVLGFLLNLVVNLIAIPKYYGEGAAFATLITQFFVLLLQVFFAVRIMNLKMNIWNIIKLTVVMGAFTAMLYTLTIQIHVNLIFAVLASGIISLLLAFIIRFITVKDFIPSFPTFAK